MAALVPSRKSSEIDIKKTNYIATKNLAKLFKNTHFIFLSTECVFKSAVSLLHNVDDLKEPETTYGSSKSKAEDFLLKKSGIQNLSIVRTSMLYGYDMPTRKNFFTFLNESMRNHKKVEIYTNVSNRPTHVEDLSRFILMLVEKQITGIFHAVSEEYINRYDLSKMFCDAYGYPKDLLIPTKQPADRKMPTYLNLKPSEIFAQQIKNPLNINIKNCLKKLEI